MKVGPAITDLALLVRSQGVPASAPGQTLETSKKQEDGQGVCALPSFNLRFTTIYKGS